jgi:hypothetical protein
MDVDSKHHGTLYRVEFDVPHHQAIAAAAQKLLTPAASSTVAEILKSVTCSTMTDVAGWADEIKHRKQQPSDDPETKDFMERNPKSGDWHFVDLPFGCSAYDPVKYEAFCPKDNVVSIIVECIQVLAKQSTRFSIVNALRLLVHLVGDVHQPLHVGCSYLQTSTSPVSLTGDPDTIKVKNLLKDKDKGGNLLILPVDANGVNLHAYWNGGLGGEVNGPESFPSLGTVVSQEAVQRAAHKILMNLESEGVRSNFQQDVSEPSEWPPLWATRSLEVSRQAYESISVIGPDARGKNYNVSWEGRDAYNNRCGKLLADQMSLGAKNLASVVNKLYG